MPGGTYNTLPPLLSSPPHTVLVIRICEHISWVTTALLGNLHPFIVWYLLPSSMYKKPGIFTPCILWQISLADLSSFNAENPCLKPCMSKIYYKTSPFLKVFYTTLLKSQVIALLSSRRKILQITTIPSNNDVFPIVLPQVAPSYPSPLSQ